MDEPTHKTGSGSRPRPRPRPEPRPRPLLLNLVVAVGESFMGKGCKPHLTQLDQGLCLLLEKARDAEILREYFPVDPLFHPSLGLGGH